MARTRSHPMMMILSSSQSPAPALVQKPSGCGCGWSWRQRPRRLAGAGAHELELLELEAPLLVPRWQGTWVNYAMARRRSLLLQFMDNGRPGRTMDADWVKYKKRMVHEEGCRGEKQQQRGKRSGAREGNLALGKRKRGGNRRSLS